MARNSTWRTKATLPKHVEFAKGLVPGLDYTYQVERSRFDQLLLGHAAEQGCQVREETVATAVRPVGREGYEVTLASTAERSGANATALNCRWIIDASGRDAMFAKPIATRARQSRAGKARGDLRTLRGC